MRLFSRNVRHPFAWSLVFSGVSLLLIEIGVLFFHGGHSRPAALFIFFGLILIFLEIVLFLPTLFRNALRNTNFRFLFKVTSAGFIYITLIFLIAIAAINTGNNLLYIVLAFMLSSITISGIVSRVVLTSLDLSVDYQDSIFAGEYTAYRLRVANAKRWLASFSVGVEGFLINHTWLQQAGLAKSIKERWDETRIRETGVPAMRTIAYFPAIPARSQATQMFQVRFDRRGLYHITGIEVTTSFPFGFFRKGKRINTSGDLVVFPALVEKAEFHSFLESHAELIPALRRGMGSDLYMLRDYVPGEDVRHMHWKASARSGRYIVKDYSPESTPSFLILLDETAPDPRPAEIESYERALSLLATLAMELREKGKLVHIVMSESAGEAMESRQDLQALLGRLSISYLRQSPPECADHPFNRLSLGETVPPEWLGYVLLCSFQPPTCFFQLTPYLNNYLNLNQL